MESAFSSSRKEQYGLELQTSAGATVRVLVSTLDPNFLDRRVAITFSPDGRRVVV